ncbi:MAG: hypothetical protein AAGE83_11200, partial [Pseudomonadota bacterium]
LAACAVLITRLGRARRSLDAAEALVEGYVIRADEFDIVDLSSAAETLPGASVSAASSDRRVRPRRVISTAQAANAPAATTTTMNQPSRDTALHPDRQTRHRSTTRRRMRRIQQTHQNLNATTLQMA